MYICYVPPRYETSDSPSAPLSGMPPIFSVPLHPFIIPLSLSHNMIGSEGGQNNQHAKAK